MGSRAGDFTFGGQLFEAYWNMFVSSLRPILFVAYLGATILLVAVVVTTMTGHDLYFLAMRGLGGFWDIANLNEAKVVSIRDADGDRHLWRIVHIEHFPALRDSMRRWSNLLFWSGVGFAMGTAIALLLYPQVAAFFARKQRERTNERGASLVEADQLLAALRDHNKTRAKELEEARTAARKARSTEEAKELARSMGFIKAVRMRATWKIDTAKELARDMGFLRALALWLSLPFLDIRDPEADEESGEPTDSYEPYSIAGFPFPWRHETTHFFAMGTTGAGKSTVLKDILAQARDRGDRAVIFDLTGTYVEAFYDPVRDTILNPLDIRCPRWSIFNECKDKVDLHTAARALVPNDGGGNDPFWVDAARLMLVEACARLIEQGKTSNEDLYREIMTSLLPRLHQKLAGTLAGPLTDPEARRMAESVRATLNANAHAIQLLPRDGTDFSIREWVRNADGNSGRFLFITCQSTHLATLKTLLTLWYDTAIHSLMDLPAAPEQLRLWFIFDELGALHRLPSLEDGMRTSRNFGGAFALGIHTIQQLWSVYGQHEGDTIASLGRTQLYLSQPDYRSADWCSAMIGKTEYREGERSTTVGVERIRDGVGWTQRTEYRALALPVQIMKLKSLEGYLVFPEGFPTARIRIEYQARSKISDGFIPRASIPPIDLNQVEPAKKDGADDASESRDSRTGERASDQPGKVGQPREVGTAGGNKKGRTVGKDAQPDMFASPAIAKNEDGEQERPAGAQAPPAAVPPNMPPPDPQAPAEVQTEVRTGRGGKREPGVHSSKRAPSPSPLDPRGAIILPSQERGDQEPEVGD